MMKSGLNQSNVQDPIFTSLLLMLLGFVVMLSDEVKG